MPVDPPRDQQGRIVPHNHHEILNDHHVIRHTTPHDLCPGDVPGTQRLASGAYSESKDGGMSVDILEWMQADNLLPLHFVTDPAHGAVSIRVGDLRGLGLQVGWDPDGGHQYHGAVWGLRNSSRRRKVLKIAVTIKKAAGET
jgi:hypothetical protein